MDSVKLSVTVRRNLNRKYDAAALKQIDAAVKRWIAADAARGIRTVHVALDDKAAMKALGATALTGTVTATKVKTAIDRLWAKLSPDYLVLFGAQDVIPYFVVANPSYSPNGDDDQSVPTDNPYACSGAYSAAKRGSYLVPDRAVGRIPDMVGDGNPAWLTDYLATATAAVPQSRSAFANAYAICCDAWKGAGAKCAEYIGEAAARVMISPPAADAAADARGRLGAKLHMIKCHGSPLDPKFYGQKGNAYPEALVSATLKPRVKPQMLAAAMCCYGAQVYSPSDPATGSPGEWPIASTYLRQGALGFAGSTMIAWVGVSQMMCADWVVAGYLKGALGGASLGRAFLEAKQDYVRWLSQQGKTPDIADEKTLIEFVLLGDPSIHAVASTPAVPAVRGRAGAGMARSARPSPLLAQERRQRRIVRAQMAGQLREALPTRSAVRGAALARAKQVFAAVQSLLPRDELKAMGMSAAAVDVHRLETRLPPMPAVGPRGLAARAAGRPAKRESLEYYWSGRRMIGTHRRIQLAKVETDTRGNVLRTSIVHSS